MYEVLRLMRYTYPDSETALADQGNWVIPPNGLRTRGFKPPRSISSAVLSPAADVERSSDDLIERIHNQITGASGGLTTDNKFRISSDELRDAIVRGLQGDPSF